MFHTREKERKGNTWSKLNAPKKGKNTVFEQFYILEQNQPTIEVKKWIYVKKKKKSSMSWDLKQVNTNRIHLITTDS